MRGANTHTPSLSHIYTHSLSLSLSLSHTHTHSVSLTRTSLNPSLSRRHVDLRGVQQGAGAVWFEFRKAEAGGARHYSPLRDPRRATRYIELTGSAAGHSLVDPSACTRVYAHTFGQEYRRILEQMYPTPHVTHMYSSYDTHVLAYSRIHEQIVHRLRLHLSLVLSLSFSISFQHTFTHPPNHPLPPQHTHTKRRWMCTTKMEMA